MRRLTGWLEKAVDYTGYFSGGLVVLMIALVLVEVFSRYGMRRNLMIGDEFSAYLLVAIGFLGAAYTWKSRNHVRITALVARLSPKIANWLRLVTLIVAFILSVSLTQAGYSFIQTSIRYRISSDTFWRTPLQVPHLIVVLGFVFLDLWLIVEIVRAVKRARSAEQVHEGSEEVVG